MGKKTWIGFAFAAGLAGGVALAPAPTQPTPAPVPVLDNRGPTLEDFRNRRRDAQLILENFRKQAGIVRPIVLAVGNCPIACMDIGTGSSAVFVFIEEALLFRPQVILEKVLAHEVGHAAAGHALQSKGVTAEEQSESQLEADAYAMHLLGEPKYRLYLATIGSSPDEIERALEVLRRFEVNLPPQAGAAKSLI